MGKIGSLLSASLCQSESRGKRQFRLVCRIIAIIFVVGASALGSGTVHGYARLTRARFVRLSGYVYSVALWGNTLVWGAEGTPPSRRNILAAGNITHFRPHILAVTPPFYFVQDVRISRGWVVWVEAHVGYDGRWRIRSWNRRTHHINTIDSYRAEGGQRPISVFFPEIDLTGDVMTWTVTACRGSCYGAWISRINVAWLGTSRRMVLDTVQPPCVEDWPSIGKNIVVWTRYVRCRGVGGSDVYLYDLKQHKKRRLTTKHDATESATNGTYVAWKDHASRWNDGWIELLRLGASGAKAVHVGSGSGPNVGEANVTWYNGADDSIVAIDFHAWKRLWLVLPYHDLVSGLLGTTSGDRVLSQCANPCNPDRLGSLLRGNIQPAMKGKVRSDVLQRPGETAWVAMPGRDG